MQRWLDKAASTARNSLGRLSAAAAGESDRLQIVIVLLIALSAIVGAGAGWRAAKASIHGDELDRAGFDQKVRSIDVEAEVGKQREAAFIAYTSWRIHDARRDALESEVAYASSAAAAGRLRAEAAAERETAEQAWSRVGAFAGATPGTLALDQGELQTRAMIELRDAQDVDPTDEFDSAFHYRKKAEHLVLFGSLLIVAAVAFTLARVRRGSDALLWLAIGTIMLLGSSSAAAYWEFGA